MGSSDSIHGSSHEVVQQHCLSEGQAQLAMGGLSHHPTHYSDCLQKGGLGGASLANRQR